MSSSRLKTSISPSAKASTQTAPMARSLRLRDISHVSDRPSPYAWLLQILIFMSVLSSKSTVHFKNEADGQEVELEVKGDWFDRSAAITYGGRPVAHISRSFINVRQIFGDKQTVGPRAYPCLSFSYSVSTSTRLILCNSTSSLLPLVLI